MVTNTAMTTNQCCNYVVKPLSCRQVIILTTNQIHIKQK